MAIKPIMIAFLIIIVNFSCEKINKNIKIEKFPNGNLKFLKKYNNHNVLHGESTWFYQDGKLKEKVMFRDGKAEGHAHYFYPSGALKSHRFWSKDKMIGYCADYYDDSVGIIKASLLFNVNGELIYQKTFDEFGRVLDVKGQE